MAALTRSQVCTLIQEGLAGGVPTDDFEPSIDTINLWLNGAIAYAAIRSYWDSANTGEEYVSDGFYSTFKNITISLDSDTGYYTATLPQLPVGLPVGWDVTKAWLKNEEGTIPLTRVARNRVGFYRKVPFPKNKTAFWTENSTAVIESPIVLSASDNKLFLTMVAAGNSDITASITIDEGLMPVIMEYMRKQLFPQVATPVDTSNDGIKN